MKRLLVVGVALMAILSVTVFARGRVGVFVGPGFAPYGWYGPYYGMYPYGPPFGVPNAGQVKLESKIKDAEVFINGNFAGTVKDLKTMTMRSGDYTIEVREPGRTPFEEQIHVVAGKTIKLHPDLAVQTPSGPTGS